MVFRCHPGPGREDFYESSFISRTVTHCDTLVRHDFQPFQPSRHNPDKDGRLLLRKAQIPEQP